MKTLGYERPTTMDTTTHYFGSLRCIELIVPDDCIVTSGGPWDEAAAYFGPLLAELNPDASVDDLRSELNETGIAPEDYADDDDLWRYVAWLVACDRGEEAVND